MENKGTVQNKSQEERLSFYAEIGKYFSPDGGFDENAFREKFRSTLAGMLSSGSSVSPSEWTSGYLTEVINYLLEKGLSDAAFMLIKAAVDEAERYGLKNVSIPASQIRQFVQSLPQHPKKDDRKKTSSDEMKRKIFDAAVEVFGSKGYHGATIDDIVALSGVGKGSVYRNFRSKEELLSRLLSEKYDEISATLNSIFQKDIDVLEQIQEMIKTWLLFIEKNHVVYRLIQVEAINPKSGNLMFYDYVVSHLPMLKERIIALNKEKKIKVTNFYTVFYGILGFIDGVAHKWYRYNMSYPLSDELPIILEVIFNGFVTEANEGKKFYKPQS